MWIQWSRSASAGHTPGRRDSRSIFVTERAVFRLTDEGVELTEIAPGIDLQKDVLDVMGFEPIVSRYLKVMDPQLFRDIPVKLNL